MAVNKKAVNTYHNVEVTSAVPQADRVQLVQMLFDGLIDALVDAESHLQRNAIAEKGRAIARASKIIVGLKGALDFEQGGELARNLNDLYDYSARRLIKANIHNDVAAVQEVKSLLIEIRGAWELIPSLLKREPVALAS